LVVAYALAGTVDLDLTAEPVGVRRDGRPVYLRDLWPSADEVKKLAGGAVRPELFRAGYAQALQGSESWQRLSVPRKALFEWDEDSTYVREPPFFTGLEERPAPLADIYGARVLAILGDAVTTDHISPAGSIPADSPAGRYLAERGVAPADFNTYGARRGNHEVLVRGTFANVRLRNLMAGGREGGWTAHHPSGDVMSMYDASVRYQAEAVPLVVFAGKEYGMGSSRDWAAKGPSLLGVRAVIAESFERIHRGNLVGMGVLPLELEPHVTVADLALDGSELVDIEGVALGSTPGGEVVVAVRPAEREEVWLTCRARIDSSLEAEYFRHGGLLPRVYRLKSGLPGHG
jgi:aconitate hydratase